MKKITLEVKPISEAPKNAIPIMSWCGKHTVVIGWREFTKREYQVPPRKWYTLWCPEIGKYVDVEDKEASGWWFVNFTPGQLNWTWGEKCGLFIPSQWAVLPSSNAIEEVE